MSFFEALQRLSCFSTRHFNQNDEVEKLFTDYIKSQATNLSEDEKTKLNSILNNLTEFQKFLYEIISKNHSNTDDFSNRIFHSNIVNLIFLLAKIGLLETNKLLNELSIVNNEIVDKKDLELEVIRETNDEISNDHVPLEIILDEVGSRVEARTKLEQFSREFENINVRKFQFSDLKKATNYFNEEIYEGIAKPGRQVGPGRIGKVFIGVNLIKNTSLVVVKRVRQIEKNLNHFLRELRIVSQLKHPNIIQLLGYSVDELPCLVYEYTAHGSLKRFLDHSKFVRNFYEANDRVSTLLQIASAIKYLHNDKEKVHGDIKPENILLNNSTAKLCGFGLTNDVVLKGLANRLAGTNFYMAPELQNEDFTWLSDVYGFGVVMLQVLTGMKVFDSHRNEFEKYLPRHIARLLKAPHSHREILINVPPISCSLVQDAYLNLLRLAISCATIKESRPNMTFIYENLQKSYKLLKETRHEEAKACGSKNFRTRARTVTNAPKSNHFNLDFK